MNENKKTVWIISQYAIPVDYGFGTRHFYLGKEFKRQGMNVYLFASSFNKIFESAKKFPKDPETYNYEVIDGIEVCWIKGFRYKKNEGLGRIFSWFVFSLRLLIMPMRQLKKPDVIILSSLSLPPILIAYYFKLKFRSKLIFEIRDIWPQTLIDVGHYSKFHPFVYLLGLIEKFGYKNSDYITATMPAADLHIKKVIQKPFNFKCTPQGIDLEALDKNADLDPEFINRFIPKDKFIIGYAGALGKSNALETIIEAVKELEEAYPNLHLVFLGDGPYKESLMELASSSKSITFAPKIPKEQVVSFLQNCHLLYDSTKAVPLYQYGLSRNKWMDYMYSGKPLLVSYSGYLSLINEANCGIVVPSENKASLKTGIIQFISMSQKERLDMGRRGKDYVLKHRTFDILAKDYMTIF